MIENEGMASVVRMVVWENSDSLAHIGWSWSALLGVIQTCLLPGK